MKNITTLGHRQWKRSILTGNALCAPWWPFHPFIWNSNTSLGLNLFILIWTIPLGLNVTSATPPFIYSVGPGNQFMLLDPDVFFAPSSVVDSFNLSSPLLIFIYSFLCRLKMARKKKCPDDKPQKPKGDRGGSSHYKQTIGNFKAETMRMCIEEIRRVESTPVPPGKKRPSRNEIAASFGLSPSSVSKRMTGKVLSMGPALGGARRGRVLNAGMFQAT